MKAVIYDHPGPPNVLRCVPNPVCPSDGVLIRVEAAAIEGGDLINRASTPPPHPNFVIGYAAAGEIIAVGENVKNRRVGQKVTSFDLAGSHAELRAVAASRTWPVPEGLDMAAAAALPIAFGTAHHCLFARGGLKRGETVLHPRARRNRLRYAMSVVGRVIAPANVGSAIVPTSGHPAPWRLVDGQEREDRHPHGPKPRERVR